MATTYGFSNDPSGYAKNAIKNRLNYTQPAAYQVKTPAFEQAYTQKVQSGQAGFGSMPTGPSAYQSTPNQFEQQWTQKVQSGQAGFGAPVGDTYANSQFDIIRQEAVKRQQQEASRQQEALQRRLASGGFGAGSGMLEAQQTGLARDLSSQFGTEMSNIDVAQMQAAEERAMNERNLQFQAENIALQLGFNRDEANRASYQWAREISNQNAINERNLQAAAEQQLLDIGYNREEANRLSSQFATQLGFDWNTMLADQSWKTSEALADRMQQTNMEILKDQIAGNRAAEDALNKSYYDMGAAGQPMPEGLNATQRANYQSGAAATALANAERQRTLQGDIDQAAIEQTTNAYYARGQSGMPLDTDDPLAVAAYNRGVAEKAVADEQTKKEINDQIYGEIISSMTYTIDENGNINLDKFYKIRDQILGAAQAAGYDISNFVGGGTVTGQTPQLPQNPQTPQTPQTPTGTIATPTERGQFEIPRAATNYQDSLTIPIRYGDNVYHVGDSFSIGPEAVEGKDAVTIYRMLGMNSDIYNPQSYRNLLPGEYEIVYDPPVKGQKGGLHIGLKHVGSGLVFDAIDGMPRNMNQVENNGNLKKWLEEYTGTPINIARH